MNGKTTEYSFGRVLKLAGKKRGWYAAALVSAFCGALCHMLPFFVMERVLENLLTGNTDFHGYFTDCLVMGGLWLGRAVFQSLSASFAHTAADAAALTMKKRVLAAPVTAEEERERLLGLTESAREALADSAPECFGSCFVVLTVLYHLLTLNWKIGLVSLIMPALGVVFFFCSGRLARSSRGSRLRSVLGVTVTSAGLLAVLPVGGMMAVRGQITAAELILAVMMAMGLASPVLTALSKREELSRMKQTAAEIGALPEDAERQPETAAPAETEPEWNGSAVNPLRKLMNFCGRKERQIYHRSVWDGLAASLFALLQIGAVSVLFAGALDGVHAEEIWAALGLTVISVAGGFVFAYRSASLRAKAGKEAVSEKLGHSADRKLADTLNRLSATGEKAVPAATGGLTATAVITALAFVFDWRAGLLSAAGLAIYMGADILLRKHLRTVASRPDSGHRAEQAAVAYTAEMDLISKAVGFGMLVLSFGLFSSGGVTLMNCLMLTVCAFEGMEKAEEIGTNSPAVREADRLADRADAVLSAAAAG